MRTHAQIIDDAGGYKSVAEKLAAVGHGLDAEQTRFWELRGGIPPERWAAMEGAGLATARELAEALEAKKLPEIAAARRDAA